MKSRRYTPEELIKHIEENGVESLYSDEDLEDIFREEDTKAFVKYYISKIIEGNGRKLSDFLEKDGIEDFYTVKQMILERFERIFLSEPDDWN